MREGAAFFRDGDSIVLHRATPPGELTREQVESWSDPGWSDGPPPSTNSVSDAARAELIADRVWRNNRPTTYANLGSVGPRCEIADLDSGPRPAWPDDFQPFHSRFPHARCWVRAYLPGYSRDGRYALVVAQAGPSSHCAMASVLLERDGDAWRVMHFTWFAFA